jgi:hypothetical protein
LKPAALGNHAQGCAGFFVSLEESTDPSQLAVSGNRSRLGPEPDRNDWIIDCEAQTTLAAMVDRLSKINPAKDMFTFQYKGEFP